jgi:hypothetical protein
MILTPRKVWMLMRRGNVDAKRGKYRPSPLKVFQMTKHCNKKNLFATSLHRSTPRPNASKSDQACGRVF